MFKKIIAVISALVLALGVLSSCTKKTEYINKGEDRVVSSQSSNDSAEDVATSKSTEKIQVFQKISDEGIGVYEGTLKTTVDDEEKKSTAKFTLAENGDIKIVLSDDSGDYVGWVYKVDTGNIYQISSEIKDSALKMVSLNSLACIKNHLAVYAINAGIYSGILAVSDDESKLKFSFNNATLYYWLCDTLDIAYSNYDEIYKLTKDDKAFKEFADGFIGEQYDTSLGLSKKAMKQLTFDIGYNASQILISNAEKFVSGTIIIDSDNEMKISVDILITDVESEKTVFEIAGDLQKTSEVVESITLPDNIITELPKKDESEPNINDEQPRDDDAPREDSDSENTDENSSENDNNWLEDDFFS